MLSRLVIENYALIDKAEIDFTEGFTVITGETGAGKSIMLDALALLMGARADSKVLGNKERKTIVEGIFSNPSKNIKDICDENNIDWDPNEIILRREISPTGKSRAYINDTPVTLNVLSSVSQLLIDIHSQHANSLLSKPGEQLAIIDSYGNDYEVLRKYQEIFKEYVALRSKIKGIKETIARGNENREFIQFRLEQLDKLKPRAGELEVLEREAEILADGDRIKSELIEAYEMIGGGESALRQIQSASSNLERVDLTLFDAGGADNISERIENIKIELRDISDTLEEYTEKIHSDPQKLEKIQTRIQNIYDLIKRFKVKDENDLVSLHQKLKEEISIIEESDTDLPKLEGQLKELASKLKERAENLSNARTVAAGKFSEALKEKLRPLGMPNVDFSVEIQKGKLTPEGQDILTFYCSFNKNHPKQPVAEIASGGEIARVMLAIKSIMAGTMNLPTIIFDEIDTGVSGEIAHKMGEMIREISSDIQVMSVTHLPQVAAMGHRHLKVYKEDTGDRTVTHIKILDRSEREREIAGMLSGDTINEVALENARVLMKN